MFSNLKTDPLSHRVPDYTTTLHGPTTSRPFKSAARAMSASQAAAVNSCNGAPQKSQVGSGTIPSSPPNGQAEAILAALVAAEAGDLDTVKNRLLSMAGGLHFGGPVAVVDQHAIKSGPALSELGNQDLGLGSPISEPHELHVR